MGGGGVIIVDFRKILKNTSKDLEEMKKILSFALIR
jgi:hypothetical protein